MGYTCISWASPSFHPLCWETRDTLKQLDLLLEPLQLLWWVCGCTRSPICPPELNIRPQRWTFSQHILQRGHPSQDTNTKAGVATTQTQHLLHPYVYISTTSQADSRGGNWVRSLQQTTRRTQLPRPESQRPAHPAILTSFCSHLGGKAGFQERWVVHSCSTEITESRWPLTHLPWLLQNYRTWVVFPAPVPLKDQHLSKMRFILLILLIRYLTFNLKAMSFIHESIFYWIISIIFSQL